MFQHFNQVIFGGMRFSNWPIRRKLIFGISLLLVTVLTLSISGFVGVYSYRSLAKSISSRAPELPIATELVGRVSRLVTTYEYTSDRPRFPVHEIEPKLRNSEFGIHLLEVNQTFDHYRALLMENRDPDSARAMTDHDHEAKLVRDFEATLKVIKLNEASEEIDLTEDLKQLSEIASQLPSLLHQRMANFADEVRGQYRIWIALTIVTSGLSLALIALSARLFYTWVFQPLSVLVQGSRCVATGDFGHRILLTSQDEMGELAAAMNHMTQRFQEIRDDLDRQVRERTREVVRSEQLASVGFLAAGVAHEINNPLAAIAFCAESLETRLREIHPTASAHSPEHAHLPEYAHSPDHEAPPHHEVVETYLKMIQDEAFRCKEITGRLLDFSRLCDVDRQPTDMTELIQGVVEMVGHLGTYAEKTVQFEPTDVVCASVNPQEMKQVVLNLLTNGLDSLDPGGRVVVSVRRAGDDAQIIVTDNGCGMSEEIQKQIFEPFFTRRRDGQGTGLGMSISYRIVHDHGGEIGVHSEGPGKGSTFTVSLPAMNHEQSQNHAKQAA